MIIRIHPHFFSRLCSWLYPRWACFICPNLSLVSVFPGLLRPDLLAWPAATHWEWSARPRLLRQLLANALKKCSEIGDIVRNSLEWSILRYAVSRERSVKDGLLVLLYVFLNFSFYLCLWTISAIALPLCHTGQPARPGEARAGDTNIFC